MDCSICFEAITAKTGCTTTSCGHTFHFSCLARWNLQKIHTEDSQNCPMCRNNLSEIECLPQNTSEESEDSEESSEDSEESEESEERLPYYVVRQYRPYQYYIPEFNEESHALWVMRTTFNRLDEGVSIQTDKSIEKDLVPRIRVSLAQGIRVLNLEVFHYKKEDQPEYLRKMRYRSSSFTL